MPKPVYSDKEFIELWKTYESASVMSKTIGMDKRNILRRKNNIEVKYGEKLVSKNNPVQLPKSNPARKELGIENGIVLVFSDAHFWPSIHTTAYKGLLWAIKEFQPKAVIANGDVFDGASISRFPRIGWDSTPSVIQELKACEISLGEIEDTKRMIQNSELSEHVKVYRDAILVPATNNVYRVLSADAPRHEGLSPTMVLFDELHAQPNRSLFDVMSLAQGARGKASTLIAITTAGVKTEAASGKDTIAYELYQRGQKIARGEIDDPTFFMAWWEAPAEADHRLEETWKAANPGFDDICAKSDFESAVLRTPEAEFRTKRCNQWVSTQSAWLPTGSWEKLAEDFEISVDEDYVLGFDGSYASDSTALCVCTIPKDGEKPKVKLIRTWEKNFGVDDDSWRVPMEEVKQTIIDYTQKYPKVREIACDPYRWASMMQELDELGLPIVEYKTNFSFNYISHRLRQFVWLIVKSCQISNLL